MTQSLDTAARRRPPEAVFDRELDLVFAAAHSQQSYQSFLNQFSEDIHSGVDAAVQIPLTCFGDGNAPQEGERVGDPSLAAFASWRLDGVSNTALRREWEAAAPDVEESREPTVAVDEHGVVIEQLPRGTSSGFFLDAPAMRKVGNFVAEASGDRKEEEEEEENEYFKAGGLRQREGVCSSPPRRNATQLLPSCASGSGLDADVDDVPEVAMGEADELGERMTFLKQSASTRVEPVGAPLRALEASGAALAAASATEAEERPDCESTPFDDGQALKAVDGVPGLVGEEHGESSLSPAASVDRAATHGDRPPCAAAEETCVGVFEEGDDAIQPFALDPTFDYDHVTLSPNPLKQIREEWKHAHPPSSASAGAVSPPALEQRADS